MKMYHGLLLVLIACVVLSTISKKHPLDHISVAKDYLEIPAGLVYVGEQQQEVAGFFISKYEVSNAHYQAFLHDLKVQGKEKDYHAALPDLQQPASWKKFPIREGAVVPFYNTYKGFADFPVVGISYEAALQYCAWLTEKAKAKADGAYDIEFRLPNHAEWTRAARADTRNSYAWSSPYLQNGKGLYYCNFKRISAEKVTYNAASDTYEIVPPPANQIPNILTDKVASYNANAFGLYHMCGNVAEMIAERGKAVGGSWNDTGYDVRVESMADYEETSPYVGFRPVMVLGKN